MTVVVVVRRINVPPGHTGAEAPPRYGVESVDVIYDSWDRLMRR